MKIAEINTIMKSVAYAGERFINLQKLDNLLKTDTCIEPDEYLVVPYYIQNNKRMELYQYEFCCTGELNFKEYILKLTGKENIEDIPEEIVHLRRNCFSSYDEPNGLADYLKFLFENQSLREEIERVFGHYTAENLYAIVY